MGLSKPKHDINTKSNREKTVICVHKIVKMLIKKF